jgi:cytochrome c5
LSTQDQKFYDIFMVVVGVLVAVAGGLFILSRVTAGYTQLKWIQESPQGIEQVRERLKPAGYAAVTGEVTSDEQPAAQQIAAKVAAPLSGPQVYNQVCMACHAAGIGGAPKMGEKSAWTARIAQGANTLHQHALVGFQGKAGVMPQKGGRVDLSDKEITEAVDYMVSQSR